MDITVKLRVAMHGSCTCMTKTPECEHHKEDCRYRIMCEGLGAVIRLRAELAAANVLLGKTGYMCPKCDNPVSSADKGCVYCELAQTKSESEWRRSQYKKIQDYVIYNRLWENQPNTKSHADMVLEKIVLLEARLEEAKKERGNQTLIEFNGYSDKPIFVEKSKIAGICVPADLGESFTTIFVCAGGRTEEWEVHEPIDVVRNKIDYEP